MNSMQKNPYTPIFTPRFHLSDSTPIGIEVKIKQRQRILSSFDAFRLIQSGNNANLLEQIKLHLPQWCEKADKPLYLSWELCSKTNPADLKLFFDELALYLDFSQMEIVFDAHYLSANEAFDNAQRIFESLPDRRIRRGISHSRPFEFNPDELSGCIDLLKLKKGVIREIMEDMSNAYQCHSFIENLNTKNIEIVADDLYSKSDVTCAILMGIKYGQGYFLSRNQAPQKTTKTLKKKLSSDFYERRFDCFQDTAWI
jgi:EAL domain-containing protein (putative c-di-GMP-specific phosphodiesterase class I)